MNDQAVLTADEVVTADEINAEHALTHDHAVSVVKHAVRCGELLLKKKAQLKHGEFQPWIEANCEFSYKAAAKYMKAYSASQKSTAVDFSSIAKLLESDKPHGGYSKAVYTGDNEWYTPAQYLDAARDALGEIDLDPATNAHAQKSIKAGRFYTPEDNGLNKKWSGRVWLNPPYARDLLPQFVDKLLKEYNAGHVTEAICLTHNYTDTEWFHSLASGANAFCFTNGRIRFVKDDGTEASPTQGQVFTYFGERPDSFARAFNHIGVILCHA